MSKYRKFWTAFVGCVVIIATQFLGDAVGVETQKTLTAIESLLTAAGVWAVPNAS